MLWPILAAVILQWEAPALQRQCIEVILCIELKQSCCENLESVLSVFAKLSWNYLPSLGGCRLVTCSVLAGIRQYITSLSIYFRDMPSFDGLYLKNCLQQTLAAFWDKYWCFIWAKQSTAWGALMQLDGPLCAPQWVHIELLLASFDVELPSEREKLSWIDWTIEIFSLHATAHVESC